MVGRTRTVWGLTDASDISAEGWAALVARLPMLRHLTLHGCDVRREDIAVLFPVGQLRDTPPPGTFIAKYFWLTPCQARSRRSVYPCIALARA
eukprot:GDKH01010308.1.p1 GENE.GDKH01010308.1~~GDKH01010308.1.p1  ORF type:complete len:93 (-),score=3.43 GDKH01010308.1:491-769(-)